MKTASCPAGTAVLLVTALLGLSPAPYAQGSPAATAARLDAPRIGGGCAEEQVSQLLRPEGCGQEPVTLPTWLGPLPGPKRYAEGSQGEEHASEIMRRLRAPEHLGRLEAEKARVQRELFGDVLEAGPETPGLDSTASRGLPRTDRIHLFISESIPLETLRNYARDIAEIGDPRIVMVLRGFVGGLKHVLPTRRFVLDVLRKDLACDPEIRSDCDLYPVTLVIDPPLFRRYEVGAVPALVYARDMPPSDPPTGQGLPPVTGAEHVWRISGDARLQYLLKRIQEEARSPALGSLFDPS